MRHYSSIAVAACVVFSVSIANAEGFASKILDYFPGKWEVKFDTEEYTATVEWKKVAGGKALAGPGTNKEGVKSFALAGWDYSKKCWVHNVYMSDGASIHSEITSCENGTYIGKGYTVNAEGVTVSGKSQNKIIDQDHFEVTMETDDGPAISKWRRITE